MSVSGKTKVVSLGLHICDVLGRPVSGIPEGQNLAILDETRMTVAETAAGASVDMAKLGLDVYALGAVGTDKIGDFVINTMGTYGIDTSGLVRKSEAQTSMSMLLIRPNGDRPALHVPGANALYSLEDVDLEKIVDADYLHFGGTGLMPAMDGEPTRQILEFAKNHGVVTTFDLIAMDGMDFKTILEPSLPFMDYFMPGLEEAEMMCGFSRREDIHSYYLEKGCGHTVFKNGGNGTYIAWLENGALREVHIPCFETTIVDSTGCGDSFCAGFIKSLSEGRTLEESAEMGSACGALVISGLGSDAGIVDWDHLQDFARNTPLSIPV
jgi:sugar/nucleoside kinase (ribokinase family)